MIFSKNVISKLKFIWNHFGKNNQFKKYQEELEESLVECKKHREKYDEPTDEFLGELVDVIIVGLQILLAYKTRCMRIFLFKLDRTIDRIKEKYYEK